MAVDTPEGAGALLAGMIIGLAQRAATEEPFVSDGKVDDARIALDMARLIQPALKPEAWGAFAQYLIAGPKETKAAMADMISRPTKDDEEAP